MATRRELAEAQRNLKNILGREAVEAAKAEQELKKFTASTKSIADSYNMIAEGLMSSNIPLLKGIGSVTKTLSSYNSTIKITQQQQASHAKKVAELQREEERARINLRNAMTKSAEEQRAAATEYRKSAIALDDANTQTKTYQLELKQLKVSKFADSMLQAGTAMTDLANSLKETQQQFGLMTGQASSLRIEAFMESIKSTIASFASLGETRAVSQKEIMDMQSNFQDQFGGVMTANAAEELAKQAGTMGVTAEQFSKARRTFITQNMGNVVDAKRAQDKFITEFTKKGLTSKEAIQAISQYSELLARNGARFQQSFARAAVDAKKIGIDLGKVSQIGDNIINDFEGFLESQANLGAMGFNFDSNRLAQIAETGSDADLFNELRSQLSGMGKDITKLRRSERLELEKAYGINISDMMKLSGQTPGGVGGEEAKSPEELQAEANGILKRIENLLGAAGPIVVAVGALANVIGGFMLMRAAGKIAGGAAGGGAGGSLLGGGGGGSLLGGSGAAIAAFFSRIPYMLETPFINLAARLSTRFPRIADATLNAGIKVGQAARFVGSIPGKVGQAVKGMSAVGKGGVLSGIFGGLEGFMTAKKSGKGGAEAAGAGLVQGGFAAGGAVLGAAILPFLGPVGPIIGGFLGNTIGKAVNKFFPSLAGNIGLVFKGITSAFEPLKKAFSGIWENIKKLGEPLSKIMNAFGGLTGPAENLWPILEKVGYFIGTALLVPLNLIMTPISLAIGAFTALAQLLTGDFSGALQTVKNTFSNAFAWITEPLMKAVDAVKGVFTGLIDWVKNLPSRAVEGTKEVVSGAWEGTKSFVSSLNPFGDDVVSRSGYGKRSLVTPSGVISLNDKDNIIAYADDLDGTKKLPYGSIAKQAAGEKFEQIDMFRKQVNDVFAQLGSPSGGLGKFAKFINTDLNKAISGKVGSAMTKVQELKTGGKEGLLSMGLSKFGGLFGGKAGEAVTKAQELRAGGKEGLLSMGLSKFGGLFGGKAGGAVAKAQELRAGGKEGLLSMAQTKLGGLFGGKAGNAFSEITKLSTGGGTAPGNLMALANRIPGVGGLVGKATGLLGKGGLKTLSTNLLGKVGLGNIAGSLAGGPITALTSMAAPLLKKIPVVGPMLGKIADAPNKLIGSTIGKVGGFAKRLFTRGKDGKSVASRVGEFSQKGIAGSIASRFLGKKAGSVVGAMTSPIGRVAALGKVAGKLFGKKAAETSVAAAAAPSMEQASIPEQEIKQPQQQQQQQVNAPVKMDLTNLEQKFDHLIRAFSNIQVNMDGNKVGKILVNNSDAASTVGLFRQQARATL